MHKAFLYLTVASLLGGGIPSNATAAEGKFWQEKPSILERFIESPEYFKCGKTAFRVAENGITWYLCSTRSGNSDYDNFWAYLTNKLPGKPPVLIFILLPKKCNSADLGAQIAYTTEKPDGRKQALVMLNKQVHNVFSAMIKPTADYLYDYACSKAGMKPPSSNLVIKVVDADKLLGFYGMWKSPWENTFRQDPIYGKKMFD